MGEWWSLLIVREATQGACRFDDFLQLGIARNILTTRLERLVDVGIFERFPLTDRANPDVPFPGAREQARRLAAFCAGYADPRVEPSDVLQSAAAKLGELVAFIERQAAAGDAAQQAVLTRGDVLIYRRDIAYIRQLARR